MSLSLDRYIHLTDSIQKNSKIDGVKQSLEQQWSWLFEAPESGINVTFEQLKKFRTHSEELLKNEVNFLPCNWFYSGITRSHQGQLDDITTTKGSMSIQWDLHLILEGTGFYQGKNYQLTAPPGTVILIPPTETLVYRRSDASAKWIHQWVAFPMEGSPADLIHRLPKTGGLYHRQVDAYAFQKIREVLHDIATKNHMESEQAMSEQRSGLEKVLAMTIQSSNGGFQTNQTVLKACHFINDNVSTNLTIDDIARQCNLSPSRVSHIFREKFGVSPIVWRNEMRLAKACQLLTDSYYSVGEIAAQVGYEDQLYFSKLFKKRMGFTPSGYRNIQWRR
ncbi:arabinose operon transcriptional regulator AraC [Pseudomaricurvus hydrocarbonicus]